MFTGDVWYDVVARGEEPSRVRINVVRFAPGARTAWHAHAVGQTLHVLEGVGRVRCSTFSVDVRLREIGGRWIASADTPGRTEPRAWPRSR